MSFTVYSLLAPLVKKNHDFLRDTILLLPLNSTAPPHQHPLNPLSRPLASLVLLPETFALFLQLVVFVFVVLFLVILVGVFGLLLGQFRFRRVEQQQLQLQQPRPQPSLEAAASLLEKDVQVEGQGGHHSGKGEQVVQLEAESGPEGDILVAIAGSSVGVKA